MPSTITEGRTALVSSCVPAAMFVRHQRTCSLVRARSSEGVRHGQSVRGVGQTCRTDLELHVVAQLCSTAPPRRKRTGYEHDRRVSVRVIKLTVCPLLLAPDEAVELRHHARRKHHLGGGFRQAQNFPQLLRRLQQGWPCACRHGLPEGCDCCLHALDRPLSAARRLHARLLHPHRLARSGTRHTSSSLWRHFPALTSGDRSSHPSTIFLRFCCIAFSLLSLRNRSAASLRLCNRDRRTQRCVTPRQHSVHVAQDRPSMLMIRGGLGRPVDITNSVGKQLTSVADPVMVCLNPSLRLSAMTEQCQTATSTRCSHKKQAARVNTRPWTRRL